MWIHTGIHNIVAQPSSMTVALILQQRDDQQFAWTESKYVFPTHIQVRLQNTKGFPGH